MPITAPRLWAARRANTWRHRCLALEQTLEQLSERLARTEVALLREEQASLKAKLRLAEAEDALIRMQSALDALRQLPGGASRPIPGRAA
ncbi:hypothetical protein E0493_19510 [Roseomonas sp. M0104]|uniref:Uncharacterized protein n=1 Tax=Teichococcus coralli TaxID=2545983 RepID=A0A845BQ53_9PROT|nr:hypothetical protein [Pseudoroseomonas coralli]MXP65539.1 hypothetical protein [Pseudoroseomonas coralli]